MGAWNRRSGAVYAGVLASRREMGVPVGGWAGFGLTAALSRLGVPGTQIVLRCGGTGNRIKHTILKKGAPAHLRSGRSAALNMRN